MNWLHVAPVALVSLGWLLIPGLLVSYAAGFRSIAAWGVAPPLSVAIVAVTAVLAQKVGIAWSLPLVLVAALLVALVVAAGAFLLRKRFTTREPDPRPVTLAAFLGLVPALVLGAVTLVSGLGSPGALSQTFDAVFHYNAVAYILDSGDASTLTLTTLGNPGMPPGFYPAAWHDLASLVVLATGTSIPVAANLLTGVLAVVIWPLSCVLLVRQIAGRSVPAMAVTGVISLGFTAFPWGLMSFGVLWPNLLGLVMVPVSAAIAVSLAGLAKDDAIGKGRAWLMLPVVLLSGGLAHPNSLFSIVVIMMIPLFVGIFRWSLRKHAEGKTGIGLAGSGIAVVVFLAAWRYVSTTPALETVRTFHWPAKESASQAFGEAMLGATNNRPTLWVLSAVVILGIVFAWRRREQNWLIVTFGGSVLLFILAAAVNTPATQRFTGYWYNDSFRLAAAIPITAVPLAVLGIVHLASYLSERFAESEQPRLKRLGASTLVLTLVITVVVAVAAKGMYTRIHRDTLAENYTGQAASTTNNLVDTRERAFYDRIKKDIPADAVVASNPWDGSTLLWALIDRRTLFPHMDLPMSTEQRYLANHLVNAGTDPVVCQDATKLGVDYVIIGNEHFWPWDNRRKSYPGIIDPAGRPGFELIDSDGDLKLYKLSTC